MKYADFLANKHKRAEKRGIAVEIDELNPMLFDWQSRVVQWALRCGRSLLAEDCGLGKTAQQLAWADVIAAKHGKVLLLCPLAVQRQTLRESEKFGIKSRVTICESQDDVQDGISITNYDKLHLFKPSEFVGVVLDESSILKAYTGKTKQALCRSFAETPFRLCATATPAPNDRMEIGNHSEFLGVMDSDEMLAIWFINSGDKVGKYVLRQHGIEAFWRWVASWAMCLSSPADIGGDASGYELPPLITHERVVESKIPDGFLFSPGKAIAATEVHQEKRATLEERADVVASIVNGDSAAFAVWCDTDYEADALRRRIPDAVEVRGSHPIKEKEAKLEAFTNSQSRVIITKPEIGGFGLNWQHAHKTTWFAGYSYERFYQAIRRMWRFGQTKPVEVYVVRSENEGSICDVIRDKEKQHTEMQREVALLMSAGMKEELGMGRQLSKFMPSEKMEVPAWLKNKNKKGSTKCKA